MILMQTIILKTSITMDSLYLKLFKLGGVIVILFIYSIKLHPHFNDSFHKTTDERYLKTRKRYNTMFYNLAMIGVLLIIGFVIALFYNPETVILREKIESDPKIMAVTVSILALVSIVLLDCFVVL
jgi:steroid 5-alpha reductase family enzyme